MARYRSCPAVSQICALMVLPSMETERVANSTPIVDLLREEKRGEEREKRERGGKVGGEERREERGERWEERRGEGAREKSWLGETRAGEHVRF